MGWVTVKNLETGEVKFYGDSPVYLDPNLSEKEREFKLLKAIDPSYDSCVLYGKGKENEPA